ncbi:MAG TPA: hypothetical protein VKA66_10670 [Mycobacterium sp.]|nr:hypothetical protein [Mycobacterium sp.]
MGVGPDCRQRSTGLRQPRQAGAHAAPESFDGSDQTREAAGKATRQGPAGL